MPADLGSDSASASNGRFRYGVAGIARTRAIDDYHYLFLTGTRKRDIATTITWPTSADQARGYLHDFGHGFLTCLSAPTLWPA